MFVVNVIALNVLEMTTHPSLIPQIAVSKQNEVSVKVSPKYADYADVFFLNLAIELSENTCINKYAIKLKNGKQPPYRPIYGLRLKELKVLKTYIQTHLKTGFI